MTNPYLPPLPAKKNNKPLIIVLSSVLAVFLLFCTGIWALGTFGPDTTTAAVSDNTTARPAFVAPTTTAALPAVEATTPSPPPTTATSSPTPAPTSASPKPAPKPTTVKPKPKPKPTTKKPAPKPTTPSRQTGVHPGAFCSPVGALGTTVKGTLMRCSVKNGDDRARWRAA